MNVNSREIETVSMTVRGRVQGVGFRIFVSTVADRLNVSGWVQNLPDGSVRLQATAPRQILDELSAALWLGPRGSLVEQVESEKIETPGDSDGGFRILQGRFTAGAGPWQHGGGGE